MKQRNSNPQYDSTLAPSSSDTTDSTETRGPWRHRWTKAWPYIKKALTLGFLALVAWLLYNHAREVDWAEVGAALSDYSALDITIGLGLAAATYTAYASYDLFGRYYTGHDVSRFKTMVIAFICCAFTLNLGAMIGSLGFRYRLYTKEGVSKGDVARIVGILISTNWLGYIALAGVVFVSGQVMMPESWAISDLGLQILGAGFLTLVLIYFGLCQFSSRRSWEVKGQSFTLPSTRIATAQLMLSSAHWALMAGIMFSFLHEDIGYFPLLGVLLISAIAGIIAHVPGALGVLEAVFIALLGGEVAPATLVAALIAYRAVFYLFPLAVAVLAYLSLELAGKRAQSRATG